MNISIENEQNRSLTTSSYDDDASMVLPGDRLMSTYDEIKKTNILSGEGTYETNGQIISSRIGRVTLIREKDTFRCVVRKLQNRANAVPKVGAIVTGSVEMINSRFAKVHLVSSDGKLLNGTFAGIIRKADVRETDIDDLKMYECFRPGDIVRAQVISLGDVRSYFLTTAKVALGVVSARTDDGTEMVPVNWREMECPVTGIRVRRKVAKIKLRRRKEERVRKR